MKYVFGPRKNRNCTSPILDLFLNYEAALGIEFIYGGPALALPLLEMCGPLCKNWPFLCWHLSYELAFIIVEEIYYCTVDFSFLRFY